MLRILSLEEVAFVSGGMMDDDSDSFDSDGGGGDGGDSDGGDYGYIDAGGDYSSTDRTKCTLGTATTPMVCTTTKPYGGPPTGNGTGTGQGTSVSKPGY